MSINLENPQSAYEKVDAATNFVEQMFLSHQIKDEETFKKAHKRAGDLLFAAMRQMEMTESDQPES